MLIVIGQIGKAHGIRGEVLVQFYAESSDLLSGVIYVGRTEGTPSPRRMEILTARRHHGNLIVSFKDVCNRDQAEALKTLDVLVPREALPDLDPEEAYLADMLGLRVLAQEDPNLPPEPIGFLTDISIPAGQELWTITDDTGQEVLLPAVPEFVLDIDLDTETVLVAPPPGLLDLYLKRS